MANSEWNSSLFAIRHLDFDLGAEFDDLSCRHAEKGG